MREAELTRSCGRTAAVRLAPQGRRLARRVKICRGFGAKLLGLMFRRRLAETEGALLVYSRPSRTETVIHMFFVPFPLGVFWLDERGTVVDRVRAMPWRPFYASAVPACYVLELHPRALDVLPRGGRVEMYEADPLS
ncbi:MAG: DUF192 domain-containing protein [Anaerolineales bacterium]|nr:DUF192 domain-containing protein [Anaerolineales bacterium]